MQVCLHGHLWHTGVLRQAGHEFGKGCLGVRAQAARADFAAGGRREGSVQVVRAVLGRSKDGEVEPRVEHVVPAVRRQA